MARSGNRLRLLTAVGAAVVVAAGALTAAPALEAAAHGPTAAPAATADLVDRSSSSLATSTRVNPNARPSTGGVRLAPTKRGALNGSVIVVDPGHNGVCSRAINTRLVPDGRGGRKACNTSGTSTNSGFAEHAHNWSVATRLSNLLRARGATVVLTRPNDRGVGPCVDERAAIGNRNRADLAISIHADGAAASARGFHIIRSSSMAGGASVTKESARLATITRDAFARGTGMPRSTYLGRGSAITPRADIAGLNNSRVPAVLLEAGNMRNARDAALLRSGQFQQRQAAALADAAQQFLRRR